MIIVHVDSEPIRILVQPHPGSEPMKISTRPQDWAPPARAILWRHLAEKMR